jgi:hypothetical protein
MTNAKTNAAESTLAPQVCRHCKGWSNSRRCGCDAARVERGEPTNAEVMASIPGFRGAVEVW